MLCFFVLKKYDFPMYLKNFDPFITMIDDSIFLMDFQKKISKQISKG